MLGMVQGITLGCFTYFVSFLILTTMLSGIITVLQMTEQIAISLSTLSKLTQRRVDPGSEAGIFHYTPGLTFY